MFFRKSWSNKSLAFFLGLAAGVMVAVVVFDMLPSALVFGNVAKTCIGLALGILIMVFVNSLLFRAINSAETLISLGYMIMLGIALHDLPEGMAIAFGDEMKSRTGMVIALGIGIHNIPEGMAIAAPLLMGGLKKNHILLKTILLGFITPLGTIIGKYMAKVLPDLLPLMLGLASGVMVYLVCFQLWPQAGAKNKGSRWWGLALGTIIILAASFF
ncbi:ZIP family metal transporter [Syntrophomonas zehnderi]|uniref:ZIP family metal transporter n=1 Tax=Syntrophomonas zehnderi TaxID=404335 RepID=UPI0012FCF0A5|nr:ZIP family metal transporter [Syntrophomonas zehnderi]